MSRFALAAVVGVLIGAAGTARAEPVTLLCAMQPSGSYTFRLDVERGTIEWLGEDGKVWYAATAHVTDSNVQWESAPITESGADHVPQQLWMSGSLNRLSGEINWHLYRRWSGNLQDNPLAAVCRRATQKF